ncbi:hypothetical protein BKA93DRAFT_878775 [Sparassis latifolia]
MKTQTHSGSDTVDESLRHWGEAAGVTEVICRNDRGESARVIDSKPPHVDDSEYDHEDHDSKNRERKDATLRPLDLPLPVVRHSEPGVQSEGSGKPEYLEDCKKGTEQLTKTVHVLRERSPTRVYAGGFSADAYGGGSSSQDPQYIVVPAIANRQQSLLARTSWTGAGKRGKLGTEGYTRRSLGDDLSFYVCGWCCPPPASGDLRMRRTFRRMRMETEVFWQGVHVDTKERLLSVEKFRRKRELLVHVSTIHCKTEKISDPEDSLKAPPNRRVLGPEQQISLAPRKGGSGHLFDVFGPEDSFIFRGQLRTERVHGVIRGCDEGADTALRNSVTLKLAGKGGRAEEGDGSGTRCAEGLESEHSAHLEREKTREIAQFLSERYFQPMNNSIFGKSKMWYQLEWEDVANKTSSTQEIAWTDSVFKESWECRKYRMFDIFGVP